MDTVTPGPDQSEAVGIPPMLDRDDQYGDRSVVDRVEDPVLSTASRVNAFQGSAQRLAHPVRVVGECPEDELDASGGHRLRQSRVEGTTGRGPERDAIGHGSSGTVRPASLELGVDLLAGNIRLVRGE